MRIFCMCYLRWTTNEFEQVWNPSNCEIWVLEAQQVLPLALPLVLTQALTLALTPARTPSRGAASTRWQAGGARRRTAAPSPTSSSARLVRVRVRVRYLNPNRNRNPNPNRNRNPNPIQGRNQPLYEHMRRPSVTRAVTPGTPDALAGDELAHLRNLPG